LHVPYRKYPEAISPAPFTLKKDSMSISTLSYASFSVSIAFLIAALEVKRETKFLNYSIPYPVTLDI
jgi:hypothetical protein